MDANKYRTAYDKAQAVQHEVWTELCQHLEHAPDAQLLSDYTATLVYTLDKDRREEALRLLRGQLYSRQLRDTGRVESWFTDCGARMGQDIEGFVANARQQYVQAGLAEEQRAEAEAKQKAGHGRFRIRPASAFAPERAAYLVQPYLPRGMVSILGGVSAAGKTSLALDVCARLTLVSYTHLRAHETKANLVCRLLLEKTDTGRGHQHHHRGDLGQPLPLHRGADPHGCEHSCGWRDRGC